MERKTIEKDEPERFIPIRAEVNSIMTKKFRSLSCSLSRDYDTADYVNMLDMLIYLVENGQTIINNRKNQQNIMNAYQSDLLHEMENAIAEPGDTYLSDKMHIVRNYRRHFEMDYKDVATLRQLRESLKDVNSDIKVYKNTLMNIALKNKNIALNEYMEGPNAYLFADSIIEPIKVVSKFAKEHPALEIRVGFIDNEVVDTKVIAEYATIPSMEGLLTMFAVGLIEHERNLSIGLNLYAEKLEEGGNN